MLSSPGDYLKGKRGSLSNIYIFRFSWLIFEWNFVFRDLSFNKLRGQVPHEFAYLKKTDDMWENYYGGFATLSFSFRIELILTNNIIDVSIWMNYQHHKYQSINKIYRKLQFFFVEREATLFVTCNESTIFNKYLICIPSLIHEGCLFQNFLLFRSRSGSSNIRKSQAYFPLFSLVFPFFICYSYFNSYDTEKQSWSQMKDIWKIVSY